MAEPTCVEAVHLRRATAQQRIDALEREMRLVASALNRIGAARTIPPRASAELASLADRLDSAGSPGDPV